LTSLEESTIQRIRGYVLGNPIFRTPFPALCGLNSREVVKSFEKRLGQEKKREYTCFSHIYERKRKDD